MMQTSEKVSDIIEYLPPLPQGIDSEVRKGWIWHVVQTIKDKVSWQKNYGIELWNPNDVRKAFMLILFRARLPWSERKRLAIEFNRALGGPRFPKNWPDTVFYTVDMLCPLPSVDRMIFLPSPKPSPVLQRLIATLYMVGTFDDKFLFGMNRYGKLIGCSGKTLCKFLNRLCSLGYLHKVKQGYSSHCGKGKGKGTWYQLDDPQALLNLFWFPTIQQRIRFAHDIASVHRQVDKVQWGDYVITPDWLFENKMFSGRRWR